MFGFLQPNFSAFTEDEKLRYRAFYCGLCHVLAERSGQFSRLGLTYDLTFLEILLNSLYEPPEQKIIGNCLPHPFRQCTWVRTDITDYTADLTVALTYFKCRDDWQDERNLTKKLYGDLLESSYLHIRGMLPRQIEAIESGIQELSMIESSGESNPDAGANCFGKLLAELFVYKEDHWQNELRALGFHLGRYIYLADAAVDYEKDLKHGSYNPLRFQSSLPLDFRPILMGILGEAAEPFEQLPLLQDESILRNIFYSGIWVKYNRETIKQQREG